MHRSPPTPCGRHSPSRVHPAFFLGALILALLRDPHEARAGEGSRLALPPGFEERTLLSYATNQFIGGLEASSTGVLFIYDGVSVIQVTGGPASAEVLFTPPDPPVFGSFLRLDPGEGSLYFGENSRGFIYTVPTHGAFDGPFDGPGEQPVAVDRLPLNFDLAFDDRGRGFVSSLEAVSENRIYLLDSNPDLPNDPVVVGIPGYSGPLAFHEAKLYYATSVAQDGDVLVYITQAQLEAGIGEGEIDFTALPEEQVIHRPLGGYFSLLFVGGELFASSSSGGRIDRILQDGMVTVEPFATAPLENGSTAWVTYLAFLQGRKGFRAGAGPDGGALYASLTDFTTFNEVVLVTPQLFFRRGYVNSGPELDLSDAIALLEHLFLGGEAPEPPVSGDLNDDGALDLSDAIYLLSYLFTGGPEPPEPFLSEGPDPTP